MGTNKTRRAKQEWFDMAFGKAKSKDLILNKEKLLASFCLACATERRTGLEILKLHETLENIKIEGNEIIIL